MVKFLAGFLCTPPPSPFPPHRGMSTIAEVVLHNRKPVVSGFFDPKGGDVPSLECAPPSGVSVWQVPLTYGRNQGSNMLFLVLVYPEEVDHGL